MTKTNIAKSTGKTSKALFSPLDILFARWRRVNTNPQTRDRHLKARQKKNKPSNKVTKRYV